MVPPAVVSSDEGSIYLENDPNLSEYEKIVRGLSGCMCKHCGNFFFVRKFEFGFSFCIMYCNWVLMCVL